MIPTQKLRGTGTPGTHVHGSSAYGITADDGHCSSCNRISGAPTVSPALLIPHNFDVFKNVSLYESEFYYSILLSHLPYV